MKQVFYSLSPSDTIQLLGIVASLITSLAAIIISLMTLRQNSKMIEDASRPVISIYGECINVGPSTFYIVIKNFGSSPAYITQFDYDFDFTSAYLKYKGEDFLKTLVNSVIAPGQSRICALKYAELKQPITFKLSYSSGVKTYHEEMTVDLTAGSAMLTAKEATAGNEMCAISSSLQEMLQKYLLHTSLLYFSFHKNESGKPLSYNAPSVIPFNIRT